MIDHLGIILDQPSNGGQQHLTGATASPAAALLHHATWWFGSTLIHQLELLIQLYPHQIELLRISSTLSDIPSIQH